MKCGYPLIISNVDMQFKHCKICGNNKTIDFFPVNSKGKFGVGQKCKVCSAKYAADNRDPIKEAIYKYKITKEEVLKLKEHPSCFICGLPNRKGKALCIDHCHTTGKVRGVLCDDCNTSLGKMKDSKELLQKAINYLEQYE
jgi:hypothetical protein